MPKPKEVRFELHFKVTDEGAFRRAAYSRVLAGGISESDSSEYLDERRKDLGQCASVLLDPSRLPGCEIHDSFTTLSNPCGS